MRKISIFASNSIEMKKIIGLFAFMLLLNGCDDGDLTIETIDFADVTAVKCGLNDLVYKIKENEALIIEIPEASNAFITTVTPYGEPRQFTIGGNNKVIYRSYSGTIATENVCSTIPPSSPNVTEEWVATSGTIEITTTPILVPNTALTSGNATKIKGYNHAIVFKNVTFDKPNGEQFFETYVFGSYAKDLLSSETLPFAFDDEVEKCSSSNTVYNTSGSEALVLNLDATFFPAASGTQTALISATNKVTYTLFTAGGLTSDNFCTTPAPTTPAASQIWIAEDGVTATSGIIEVVTTTLGSQFQHTIHLKKVTFTRNGSEFYLGDDYIYGSFIQ
jgi:hypothetical protein